MTIRSTRPSCWQRWVCPPLIALFTQGITPDRVAFTLALGAVCSLFPFLGFTSLLNFGVGLWLRLNQPLLQTLNQVLGALQLVMIVAYVRLGELLWHTREGRFTVAQMLHDFHAATFSDFLRRFGWAGIHAFTSWALTSPLLFVAIYYPVRPALRRLASTHAAKT